MKKIMENISRIKTALLIILAILFAGTVLMLGRISHMDFEDTLINAELRELLIIAKSVSHDIENKIVGFKQEPQYIYRLIQNVNNEENFSTFILDKNHIILNDPVKSRIGKNIFEIAREALNTQELYDLNAFVEKVDSNDSGTAILSFPRRSEKPGKEMKLFAFAHFQGQNGINSIVVTESLNALTGPLHKNLRDILVLVGLFVFGLLILGYIFYRVQAKRIKTETTVRALEIINKQLHCEIEDYKCIEKKLKDHKK